MAFSCASCNMMMYFSWSNMMSNKSSRFSLGSLRSADNFSTLDASTAIFACIICSQLRASSANEDAADSVLGMLDTFVENVFEPYQYIGQMKCILPKIEHECVIPVFMLSRRDDVER